MNEDRGSIHRQVGEYRLVRQLGTGSFGEVYLGVHVRDQSQAAIKLLGGVMTHSEDIKEFINEARTFRLQHAHIVPLLDFGIDAQNIPFLVMEYAPHGTLRDLHPRGTRVPFRTVASYVAQVASALQYAHSHRVIHRDVKPANMLVGSQGQILLSDFGIAAVSHSSQSIGAQNEFGGTLPYSAPEQIQGQPRPASDQYSLAVVAYEWLSGRRPFLGNSLSLIASIASSPPPPLCPMVPDLPVDAERVLFVALSKDPKSRFGNIQAFSNAFWQACGMPDHPPVPVVNVVDMPPSPSPSPFPSAFALSASPGSDRTPETPFFSHQIAPTQYASGQSNQMAPTRYAAGQSGQIAPTQYAADQRVAEGQIDNKRSELIRRRLVFGMVGLAAGLVAVGGGLALYSASQSPVVPVTPTPTPVPLPPIGKTLTVYKGHTGVVTGVAWSPNGKTIASTGGDQTVQIWDPFKGGRPQRVFIGHKEFVNTLHWSPNGQYIVSGGNDDRVLLWDVSQTANTPIFTYTHHTYYVADAVWSPDGKLVASSSLDGSVQIWDPFQRVTLSIDEFDQGLSALVWSPDGKRIAVCALSDRAVYVLDATRRGAGTSPLITRHASLYAYRGHTSGSPVGISWSRETDRIVSSGAMPDQSIQVWSGAEANIGKLFATYRIYSGVDIETVIWSPDGRYIAAACYDGISRIWDTQRSNPDPLLIYTGQHTQAANLNFCVSWSPDGHYVVSSYNDNTAQVWRAV